MRTSGRRMAVGVVLVSVLGCARGSDEGLTGLASGPWQLPGDSGDSDPADSGTTTDATAGGTTMEAPADSSGDPSTGTPPGGSSDGEPQGTFGGGNDAGMQPESGWWAHCIPDMIACDAGFACLSTDASSDGVCTSTCLPAGDASACGDSPGGTTQPVCLSVGGDSVCALGCEGGLTCPGGMICVSENDDLGPISICI